MALEPEQRKNVYRAKLTSLVRSHFSDIAVDGDAAVVTGTAHGATLRAGDRAVALIEGEEPVRALGAALLAARQSSEIILLAADHASLIAAIAQQVSPVSAVWSVVGTELHEVAPARLAVPVADVDNADQLVSAFHDAGATVLVRDGTLVGEVLGVEVGRIVETPDGARRIDVGVGEYDQNAFAMMHPGSTPTEALAQVIEQVRLYRRPDAAPHPLNRLARARWLRSLVVANPASIGLRRLTEAPDLVARIGIREDTPAIALGTDEDGALTLVACAVGVGVDALALAAYGAAVWEVERIVVVMPERDRYPFVEETAALLRVPCQFAAAEVPWPA